ncbi:MAG: nitroreductase [Clostridiaceae bacterium]|nr:nitroreductase [Clostridiaceae bacterium]
MNIKEVISLRKSIRTYRNEPLSRELRQKLESFIESVKGPFDTKMRFVIVDSSNEANNSKLGTYGVISGAKTFICAVVEPSYRYEENLGYAFEKIVLYATSLGLGTCWLGGTFNKSAFSKAVGIKDGEFMPIVSPVGYAKEKRSLIDSFMVISAGSKNRKDWSELFFEKTFDIPLSKEKADPFTDAMEMVRLAPSASNKQPWRIVKDGNVLHFFLKRTVGYKNIVGFDIQRLDIGIAMCHLELTMDESGLKGEWTVFNPGFTIDSNTEYIISYRLV